MTSGRGRAPLPPLLLALAVVLAACSTNDDEGDDLTSAPPPTATLAAAQPTSAAPTAATTGPVATLTDAAGNLISDGFCQATIPDGWVDDGTGRGTTTSGARFTLFGSSLTSNAAWQQAAQLVATPTSGRPIAAIERTETSVRVFFAEDRGFEYRARFADRYCDLYIYRTAGAVPEQERGVWEAVIASLGPAE